MNKDGNNVIFTNSYAKKYGDDVVNPVSFRVYKVDENGQPIGGAKFTLYESDGSTQVGAAQTTDATGYATFEELLPDTNESAYTYILKETGVPQGYTQSNTNGWKVHVSKEAGVEIEPSPSNDNVFQKVWNWVVKNFSGQNGEQVAAPADGLATLKVTNTRQKASLTVTKTVAGDWTPGSDYSVEIDVYAKSDTGKTKILYECTLSGSTWSHTFEDVPTGEYVVVETVNNGPDKNLYTVVEAGTADVEVTATGGRVTLTNDYTRKVSEAGLTITKNVTGENGVTIPTNDPFTFTVKSTGGSYKLDGQIVPAGSEKTITLVKDGTVTLTDIEYGTTFTITETEDAGYTLTGVKLNDEAKDNGLSVTIDETTASAAVTFTNTYVTQSVTFTKVDFDDKTTGLSGAKFELRSGDTKVATATSDDDGTVIFDNVPVGTYDLWETQAPTGYETANKDTGIDVVVTNTTVTFKEPGGVATFISGLLKTG